MAIVRCPECKGSVSNKAFACPSCGFPIASNSYAVKRQQIEDERKRIEDENRRKQADLWRSMGLCTICGGSSTKSKSSSHGHGQRSYSSHTIECLEHDVPIVCCGFVMRNNSGYLSHPTNNFNLDRSDGKYKCRRCGRSFHSER